MSVAYYNDPLDSKIVESICNRLRIFYSVLLYGKEPLNDALKRIVRASIISSPEDSFYQRSSSQKDSNTNFPFTAWSLGEVQEIDQQKINTFARAGTFFYSNQVDAYITQIPMKLPILFYHFFEKTSDYQYALTQLLAIKSGILRFLMPVRLNGKDVLLPIILDFKTSRGNYAHDFIKWLSEGKINDIFQVVTVSYYDIILNQGRIQNEYDSNGNPTENLIKPTVEVIPIEEVMLILENGNNLTEIERLIINSNS